MSIGASFSLLKCTMGTMPVPIIATPKPVMTGAGFVAGPMDLIPNNNILPFGVCMRPLFPLVPFACTPVVPAWLLMSMSTTAMQSPVLKKGSQAICPLGGGVIEIIMGSLNVNVV